MSRINFLQRVSQLFQERRFRRFCRELEVQPSQTRLLDLGGYAWTWQQRRWEGMVCCVNLDRDLASIPPNIHAVLADAQALPFPDRSFDVVYCNSLLEHVADPGRLAREILRVGKQYWVQTPNRNFPIEPHALFPLFQFFPQSLKVVVFRWWSKILRWPFANLEELLATRLFTAAELRALFPGSRLLRERFLGMTKSLVACGQSHGLKQDHEASALADPRRD